MQLENTTFSKHDNANELCWAISTREIVTKSYYNLHVHLFYKRFKHDDWHNDIKFSILGFFWKCTCAQVSFPWKYYPGLQISNTEVMYSDLKYFIMDQNNIFTRFLHYIKSKNTSPCWHPVMGRTHSHERVWWTTNTTYLCVHKS